MCSFTIAAHVMGPTIASTDSPCICWNALTAWAVMGPKILVSGIVIRFDGNSVARSLSKRWNCRILGPCIPSLKSTPGNGGPGGQRGVIGLSPGVGGVGGVGGCGGGGGVSLGVLAFTNINFSTILPHVSGPMMPSGFSPNWF